MFSADAVNLAKATRITVVNPQPFRGAEPQWPIATLPQRVETHGHQFELSSFNWQATLPGGWQGSQNMRVVRFGKDVSDEFSVRFERHDATGNKHPVLGIAGEKMNVRAYFRPGVQFPHDKKHLLKIGSTKIPTQSDSLQLPLPENWQQRGVQKIELNWLAGTPADSAELGRHLRPLPTLVDGRFIPGTPQPLNGRACLMLKLKLLSRRSEPAFIANGHKESFFLAGLNGRSQPRGGLFFWNRDSAGKTHIGETVDLETTGNARSEDTNHTVVVAFPNAPQEGEVEFGFVEVKEILADYYIETPEPDANAGMFFFERPSAK